LASGKLLFPSIGTLACAVLASVDRNVYDDDDDGRKQSTDADMGVSRGGERVAGIGFDSDHAGGAGLPFPFLVSAVLSLVVVAALIFSSIAS
jgi:hypothetical protein